MCPTGGRYDGCSGVIAGIRVAQALREEGVVPAYTLMILGLNDEEGVALTEGFLSSRGVCGEIDEAALDRVRHRTTGESLRQLTGPERREHISCPKNAEAIWNSMWSRGRCWTMRAGAWRWWSILWHLPWVLVHLRRAEPRRNHPPWSCAKTPCRCSGRSRRPCPILAKRYPKAVATIGNVEVDPNAPNVIPGSVRFSVDLRHTDKAVMAGLAAGRGAAD